MSAAISVVVPVFNAATQTGRCLRALLASLADDTRVIVIDDASTEAGIPELLERACRGWTLLRQRHNQGFVATVNNGMREAGSDDVVLLNSDTVPAGNWLTQLRRCAAGDDRIASITPWSNNGEIVSLPELCRAAPVPDDPERWARACAAGTPEYPELPTAVGFCMYLRRACLDEIGLFDAETFGRGYGEENDWCMRATAAGWRHVLCDSAFVAHEGGASFAPLGLRPDADSMGRLLARHPDYQQRVMEFIRRDPLADVRARVISRL